MRSARASAKKKPARRAAAPVPDLPFEDSVGYQVRATNRAFQTALRDNVETFGVSPGMWYFLRLLWQHDGLTQRELARRIGLMEPTAFAALTAMERRGLIRRVKNVADRRKVNVHLTAHGKALRETMLPIAHDVNADGLKGLAKDEVLTLLGLLKRIERNLSDGSAQGRRGRSRETGAAGKD
jgi:MarR family transcriptional regulator, organic hydroperoxide resistance regulator